MLREKRSDRSAMEIALVTSPIIKSVLRMPVTNTSRMITLVHGRRGELLRVTRSYIEARGQRLARYKP